MSTRPEIKLNPNFYHSRFSAATTNPAGAALFESGADERLGLIGAGGDRTPRTIGIYLGRQWARTVANQPAFHAMAKRVRHADWLVLRAVKSPTKDDRLRLGRHNGTSPPLVILSLSAPTWLSWLIADHPSTIVGNRSWQQLALPVLMIPLSQGNAIATSAQLRSTSQTTISDLPTVACFRLR